VLRLPKSPRARRRLAWRVGIAIVIVVLAVPFAFFRNTGHSLQTPTNDKPAIVVHTPKSVHPTAADRRAAERTIGDFVKTAIVRDHPGNAWDLATPHMREGSSRAEWAAGTLPVPPYPLAAFRTYGLTLKYSYHDVLGYDVLVLPKSSDGVQQVYACELDKLHGSWLIDFCYPRTTL
jgi:hypothetical protein